MSRSDENERYPKITSCENVWDAFEKTDEP
jgi:hypothetical protein